VDDADVRRLFSGAFDVEMLQEEDAMLGETRGCTYFKVRAWPDARFHHTVWFSCLASTQ
jgi:hypothetical protein